MSCKLCLGFTLQNGGSCGGKVGGTSLVAAFFKCRLGGQISLSAVAVAGSEDHHIGVSFSQNVRIFGEGLSAVADEACLADAKHADGNSLVEKLFGKACDPSGFGSAGAATGAATGSAGTVKAYKSGDNTWQLIVAPQTASPKLALTTASGKQFTFVLSENVTFTSGKVSTATVEVSTETIYTSFTPEIEDWVADNELNFSQDEESEDG